MAVVFLPFKNVDGMDFSYACGQLEYEISRLFEAKYSRTPEAMEADCSRALHQMAERGYAKDYDDTFRQVLCYGIAFYKKRCRGELQA